MRGQGPREGGVGWLLAGETMMVIEGCLGQLYSLSPEPASLCTTHREGHVCEGGNSRESAPPKRRAKSSVRRGLYSVRPASRADAARSNAARLFTEKNKYCPARPLRQTAGLTFPMVRILGAQGKRSLRRMKSQPQSIQDSLLPQQAIRGRVPLPKASRRSTSFWDRVTNRLCVARSCPRERGTSDP